MAIYSRVAVRNPTGHPVRVDPEASAGLDRLASTPVVVGAHTTVDHDYVVAVDRFGQLYPWPSPTVLRAAPAASTST